MRRLAALLCAASLAVSALAGPAVAATRHPSFVRSAERAAVTYQRYTGTSDRVIRVNFDAVTLLRVRYTGSEYFAIWTLNHTGGKMDLPVDTVGAYSGTTAVDASTRHHIRALAVTGGGPWTIVTKPLQRAKVWKDATITGAGDNVLRVPVGKLTLKAVSHGSGYFAIWALNSAGRKIDLLLDQVGGYHGTTVMPPATAYVTINANPGRTWTLTKR